jgi:hypothetical protein
VSYCNLIFLVFLKVKVGLSQKFTSYFDYLALYNLTPQNVSIRKTISEDILEKILFAICRPVGACCVDGDAGPLSVEETKILEEIYPKVKPLRNKELLLSKRKELGP